MPILLCMKQKIPLPSEASQALVRLGQRLVAARKLRAWSSQSTAARCGINRNTLRALEQGMAVNTGVLLKVLSLYNMIHEVELLAQPENDSLGQALSNNRHQPELDNNF